MKQRYAEDALFFVLAVSVCDTRKSFRIFKSKQCLSTFMYGIVVFRNDCETSDSSILQYTFLARHYILNSIYQLDHGSH